MAKSDGRSSPRAQFAEMGDKVAAGARQSRFSLGDAWQGVLRRARAQAPATMVALLLLLLALVLDGTPQGRDVVAAQFRDNAGWRPLGLLAFALALSSFVAWIIARKAVIDAFGHKWQLWTPWPRQKWLLNMPRLLWAAPLVIVVVPLALDPDHTIEMAVGFGVVWLLSVLIGVLFLSFMRGRRALFVWQTENDWDKFPWLSGIGPIAGLGFVALIVVMVSKVEVPRIVGAPALALFAIAFLMATLGCFYHLAKFDNSDKDAGAGRYSKGDVRFLPVLGMLAIWAAAWSWHNDNHEVAKRSAAAPLGVTRPDLADAVEQFVAQLPLDDVRGSTVPIFFVASAGGASRAAYWTGEVLGKIEADTEGRFGRHVFAISSVSGGTLGAATYLAERAENTPYPALLDRMRCENGADHLSPTIAGLLFPDMLQRFIPWGVLPDRAEYLERGFEASWPSPTAIAADGECPGAPDVDADNRFARRMLDLWQPPASGPRAWVPVLLANGTRAEDGRRIVTTNVKLPSGTLRDALDFHDVFGRDVPLSVVVTNSARFPLVSPSGTLPQRDGEADFRGHIIDGGYFENGGIATLVEFEQVALPLIDAAIHRRNPKLSAKYVIVEINNDDGGDPGKRAAAVIDNQPVEPTRAVGALRGLDALLPVFGLYQTRGARGTLEALRTRAASPQPDNYVLFQLCTLQQGDRTYPTEMNWALSKAAKDRLNTALSHGDAAGCRWGHELKQVTDNFLAPIAAATSVPH